MQYALQPLQSGFATQGLPSSINEETPRIRLPVPQRSYRLAINGYGRIGRCFLRALIETGLSDRLQIVAINEPADFRSIVYLTRFDSTHGRFPGTVETDGDKLVINGRAITVTHASTPEEVDWSDIDLVVECSGQYGSREQLERFLAAGCTQILVSHPANSAEDVDATIVYGCNENVLNGSERIVSNASCTTNAVVPVLDIVQRAFGIEQVLLTTLHAAMNDQPLIDGYHHSDLRRTRSAMQSIIPVSTGLARGVERLLPTLSGRVQAKAIRVPTHNVSAIDLVIETQRAVTPDAINTLLAEAAAGPQAGRIAWSDDPHVSIDFNHDGHSAIVDASQTRIADGRLVNLMVWFDNEWGFANRMVDVAKHWLEGQGPSSHQTPPQKVAGNRL